MEAGGLLVSKRGGGTFVADVIGTVFSDPIVDLFRRSTRAAADYLEFRRELESLTAGLAAHRATPEDREILTQIFHAMEAAHDGDDPAEEAAIDVEFHTAICEAAHNIVLLHILRSCYQLLAEGVVYNRSELYRRPGARDQLLDQHRAIFNAIIKGDADTASAAARAHIAYVETVLHDMELTDHRQEVSRMRLQRFGDKAGARSRGRRA